MKKDDNKTHIAIAIDKNYIVPFYVLLTSIFLNNKKCNFAIHTIMTGVSDEEKEEMSEFVNQNQSELNFYLIDEKLVRSFPLLPGYPGFTSAVYYRLFFPLLIADDVNKLLYLDTDTLIVGDISSLYNMNIDDVPLGAAVDTEMEIRSDLGIHSHEEYFNSGILLINVPLWREQKITEKAISFLKEHPKKIKFVDQDALNVVLHRKWRSIEKKFNLMFIDVPREVPQKELKHLLNKTVIVHFNKIKPWSGLSPNRLRHIFFEYLRQSPKSGTHKFYFDFRLKPTYLISFTKVRLVEAYLSVPLLVKLWRRYKSL